MFKSLPFSKSCFPRSLLPALTLILLFCNNATGASSVDCGPSQHLANEKRQVKFVNDTGHDIQIHWITNDSKRLPFIEVKAGLTRPFGSYQGHRFVVQSSTINQHCIVIGSEEVQLISAMPEGSTFRFNSIELNAENTPFRGTAYITPLDASSFKIDKDLSIELSSKGKSVQQLYTPDRKNVKATEVETFQVTLSHSVEHKDSNSDYGPSQHQLNLLINTELEENERKRIAQDVTEILAKLPFHTTRFTKQIEIHPGKEIFTANPAQSSFILTEGLMSQQQSAKQFTGAVFHETLHNALDRRFANNMEWFEAQSLDNGIISDHAFKSPLTEDLAESYMPYYLLNCEPDLLDAFKKKLIKSTIPNRMMFFDKYVPASCKAS